MLSVFRNIKKLGCSRTNYVVGAVEHHVDKLLDVGCSYGWALSELKDKANALYGIDMNGKALQKAAENFPYLNLTHQTAATLPYSDKEFDVVILSDVIEHVGDENKQLVIDEIFRVLKPGGVFIFTAPHKGIFAWADPMDFKRQYKWLYKIYMKVSNYTPVDSIELGHKPVSYEEISSLFKDKFEVEEAQYSGVIMHLLSWIITVSSRMKILPNSLVQELNRFRAWESGVRCPAFLASNIRLVACRESENKNAAVVERMQLSS